MSSNRFALLDMGDDDEVIAPQIVPEVAPAVAPAHEHGEQKSMGKTREWNLEKRRFNKPFARGYGFHDDKKPVFVPLKTYAFQDEDKSPLPSFSPQVSPQVTSEGAFETKKPTTPVDDEFPKLSDYERPRSPPYPPDDREYPTLAERLKRAIEKETQFVGVEKVPTMEMVTVIPVRTKFASKISIV